MCVCVCEREREREREITCYTEQVNLDSHVMYTNRKRNSGSKLVFTRARCHFLMTILATRL